MIFLVCVSNNSKAKTKSYMNEELNLAIEERRQMAPGQAWIIPVRFGDVQLPDWELSAGRNLSDINYIDFLVIVSLQLQLNSLENSANSWDQIHQILTKYNLQSKTKRPRNVLSI